MGMVVLSVAVVANILSSAVQVLAVSRLTNVALTGGSGKFARATLTSDVDGKINTVTITNAGTGYKDDEVLSRLAPTSVAIVVSVPRVANTGRKDSDLPAHINIPLPTNDVCEVREFSLDVPVMNSAYHTSLLENAMMIPATVLLGSAVLAGMRVQLAPQLFISAVISPLLPAVCCSHPF